MSYVHPSLLDPVLDVATGRQYWLAFHTDDPEGASGLHESIGLGRQPIGTALWDALYDDHPLGGRMATSGTTINFGQSSAAELLRWTALWSDENGGTALATRILAVPIQTAVGMTVLLPAGNFRFRAYGGASETTVIDDD
jgi:hypothetical protein